MNSLIKNIKYKRMKPEEKYLSNIFKDAYVVIIKPSKNIFIMSKNDTILVEYTWKINYITVDNIKIWKILEYDFGLNINQINNTLKKFLKSYLGNHILNNIEYLHSKVYSNELNNIIKNSLNKK